MKYRTIGTDPKTRREVSVLSLGTMHFGTATDEATSFAILDRYVQAGGTFIDTSGNYAFWVGTQGGESEELLGRWRRSRGVGDEIVIATKVGARPLAPGTSFTDNAEGLSARVIRESAERSRDRLGMSRLDLLYAHIDDPKVPLGETVEAFRGAAREAGRGPVTGPPGARTSRACQSRYVELHRLTSYEPGRAWDVPVDDPRVVQDPSGQRPGPAAVVLQALRAAADPPLAAPGPAIDRGTGHRGASRRC